MLKLLDATLRIEMYVYYSRSIRVADLLFI